jgi:peptide/nickel transport system substrate-binding protein
MRLLGGVVLAAVGMLVTACASSGGGGTSSAAAGGWATSPVDFVYAGLSPTHIDPALANDLDSFTVTRNLYDPLVWTDDNGQIIPWLATAWKTSANGLSTTFTLRSGVKFSDGSSFTSADVKTSIDREIALKAGDSGELLTSVTSVATPDAHTAVINTSAPDPYLLAHLTRVGIISTAGVKAHKTTSDPWATNWYDNHSDGTGP